MIRVLIAVAVLASLNAYVGYRIICRWPWAGRHWGLAALVAFVFFLLQLVAPFGDRLLFPALRRHFDLGSLVLAVNWISYGALGVLSSAVLYTLVADLVGLVWASLTAPARPVDFNRRALLTLGLATLGTTAVGIRQAVAGPVVKAVEIPLAGLPAGFDGFTIAQISDLHVGPTIGRDYVENVVEMTNALKPDLVALTGDMIDGTVAELRPELVPLTTLAAPHGVYYVTGNHEYYWNAAAWIEEFRRMGTRVLLNRHEVIRKGGDGIVLAGVTDYSTRHMDPALATDPAQALAGAPEGLVKILLAHQPASYEAAFAAGFDLQLSGHTHAGQYFPVSLLIGLFQRYTKGLNRHGNMQIYVNSGTGYWGPPLRTANPSEVTLIRLRRA